MPTVDDEFSTKENREEYPTGWMKMMQQDGIEYVIDALLEAPPNHSSTIKNLTRRSGVEEKTVRGSLSVLEELDVVTVTGEEYEINNNSKILNTLIELGGLINSKGEK